MAFADWLTVSVDLCDHPKTVALQVALKDDLAEAYLIRLWSWAARVATDGRLRGDSAETSVARACRWRGDSAEFLRALIDCGWIDRDGSDLTIHDWMEHAGKFLKKAADERDRWHKRKSNKLRGVSAETPRELRAEKEKEKEKEIKKPSPAAPEATAQKPAKAIEAQEPKPARAPRQPSAQEQIARRLDAARALAHPELTAWPCDSAAFVKQVNAQFAFGTAIRAAHDADPALFARAWEHYLADPYWRDHGGWPLGGFLSRDKWREHLDSVRAAPPASGGCKLYRPEIDGDLYPDPGEPNPPPFMPSRTGAAHG